MKTPEDDEFDRIEREQAMGWRKRQIVNEIEKNMNNEPVAWLPKGMTLAKPKDLTDCIPLYIHPAKTLTDEEILATFNPKFMCDLDDSDVIDFGRAILRKAQEK